MADAMFFRRKAEQCRELCAQAETPEVIAQLELWAHEFEEEAARVELTPAASSILVVVGQPQSG